MKKILAIILASLMIFTFTACTAKQGGSSNNGDTGNLGEKAQEDYEDSLELFSVEAAEYYLEKATGIKLAEIEPDWEWEFASDYSVLGEDGRALASFTKKDGGEISQEDITAYYKKVFDVTAAASDDGHNIIGYEFVGEGEDALGEAVFEDAISGWIPGWAFKKNGTIYAVYVGSGYDNDKEGTYSVLYYNSVEAEITEGMQKSWDDYMGDIEENADEIEEALEDFAN